jgi:hypothetical protein
LVPSFLLAPSNDFAPPPHCHPVFGPAHRARAQEEIALAGTLGARPSSKIIGDVLKSPFVSFSFLSSCFLNFSFFSVSAVCTSVHIHVTIHNHIKILSRPARQPLSFPSRSCAPPPTCRLRMRGGRPLGWPTTRPPSPVAEKWCVSRSAKDCALRFVSSTLFFRSFPICTPLLNHLCPPPTPLPGAEKRPKVSSAAARAQPQRRPRAQSSTRLLLAQALTRATPWPHRSPSPRPRQVLSGPLAPPLAPRKSTATRVELGAQQEWWRACASVSNTSN